MYISKPQPMLAVRYRSGNPMHAGEFHTERSQLPVKRFVMGFESRSALGFHSHQE